MAVMDSTANIQNALAPLMSFIGVHLFTYILVNFIMCSCSEWNMFPVPHTHRTRKYVLCRCPVQQPQPLPQQSKIQIESSNKTLLTLLTAAACEFHLNANECEQFFLIVLSETMRLFGWIGGQFEHLSIRCADAACDYDISNVSFSIFFFFCHPLRLLCMIACILTLKSMCNATMNNQTRANKREEKKMYQITAHMENYRIFRICQRLLPATPTYTHMNFG